MTISTETPPAPGAAVAGSRPIRRRGSLPRWAPGGTFAVAAVVAAALILSGLALFVITFLVNFFARAIVNRRAEFAE